MERKPLAFACVSCLVVLGAGALWWLGDDGTVPLAPPAHGADEHAAASDAAAAGTAHAGEATEASSVADVGTVRDAAASLGGSGLPFPDDAAWVAVRVVDRATREPVAGATVGWVGEGLDQVWENATEYDPDLAFLGRSIELQVERAGWQTTTDAEGFARVTLGEWTTVIAEHDGRYGQLHLQHSTPPPPGGHVLELAPDLTLRVQVLDDGGAPASGVPVGIGIHDGGKLQQFWGWDAAARTDGPDGIAVIRHVQALSREDEEFATKGQDPERYRARIHLPGIDDAGVAFTLTALSDEPIVLRLPPCGRVCARAEIGGEPMRGFAGATLREHVAEQNVWRPDRCSATRGIDADGWVRFAHVPLGRELVVGTESNGSLQTTFRGPVARDQEVRVVIAPTPESILLAGRMLDVDRQPLRDTALQCTARGPKFRRHVRFRTDANGRFLITVGKPRDDSAVDLLRFDRFAPDAPPLRAELAARTLRAGIDDLGDVVLGRGERIVAGSFIDEHGPCTKRVRFWLERYDETISDPERQWRRVQDVLAHQDGTGRFELSGTAPPGRLRLQFGQHDRLPTEPVEFAPGTDDLEVRLRSGHALTVTVVHDEQMPEDAFYAELRPAGATASPLPERDAGRHRVRPWASETGERSHLQWPALEPGTYAMELRLWAHDAPLLRIDDVVVPPPEGGDPRLADIDLGALVRVLTLRLHDAEGKLLADVDGLAFAAGQDPAATWSASMLYQPTTRLLLPRQGAKELLVTATGYQPARIAVADAAADLRLHRWPTLPVEVAGVPELPAKVRLVARLEPEHAEEVRFAAQWSNGSRKDLFAVPDGGVTVQDGRALVPIGEGPHHVVLTLWGHRRHIDLPLTAPARVLPTSGGVRVEVAAENWRTALEQVQKPPK